VIGVQMQDGNSRESYDPTTFYHLEFI